MILVFLIVIGIAAFVYGTREPSAPSTPIDTASGQNELPAQEQQEVYRISQEKSTATFTIDEMLRGKPFTVIGTTNQIAGDIAVSAEALEVGTITINARTLKTDSTQRDGAIARLILQSEKPENEFITFKPTSVEQIGEGMVYRVTGDLTISGITKPAVLDVQMNTSAGTLTGTAEGVLKRSDYNLVIPNIPFVANVPDEFTIKADIVAELVAN